MRADASLCRGLLRAGASQAVSQPIPAGQAAVGVSITSAGQRRARLPCVPRAESGVGH